MASIGAGGAKKPGPKKALVGIDNILASIGANGASPKRKEEKKALVGIDNILASIAANGASPKRKEEKKIVGVVRNED